MSAKPTAADSGLQRLLDEGYEAEVRQQHLLVHSVPSVAADGTLTVGTLICKYIENGGTIMSPRPPGDNHQVWWTGPFPCRADRSPILDLVADITPQNIHVFEGCIARHQFSNKPEQWNADGFPDHYEKITHYITVIQSQARVVDPDATAQTKRIIETVDVESVFRYADTASVRAEIVASAAKLRQRKVAIVGLGGTGGYVLDQVAKTPVLEIHLFDGDRFKQHNAFRAPGAPTRDQLRGKLFKVEYFLQLYDPMRKGIVPHPYFLIEGNVAELTDFDFVFVCVDDGGARRIVCEFLAQTGVPFIDVGMDVVQDRDTFELDGTCRVTTVTPNKKDHLARSVPMDSDKADALYRQNIQVADLNSLNAVLAVIKWKQLLGFYEDVARSQHAAYTVATQSLTRGERAENAHESE